MAGCERRGGFAILSPFTKLEKRLSLNLGAYLVGPRSSLRLDLQKSGPFLIGAPRGPLDAKTTVASRF